MSAGEERRGRRGGEKEGEREVGEAKKYFNSRFLTGCVTPGLGNLCDETIRPSLCTLDLSGPVATLMFLMGFIVIVGIEPKTKHLFSPSLLKVTSHPG